MKAIKAKVEDELSFFHQPALLKETIAYLNIKPGEFYIDCTAGGGGHAEAILKKGGRVFGLDWDPEAVSYVNKHLKKVCPNACWQIIKASFIELEEISKKYRLPNPAGILFDLGVSSHQLETKGRGFSFLRDEPLDMRMDPKLKVTAADLINGLHKGELNELFSRLGEEKLALPIARALVFARKKGPIRTTKQLAEIVTKIYRQAYKKRSRIHPATKVFLSLRIAVNDELNNLKSALPQAGRILKKKGRIAVISFHGLEERIVKDYFKKGAEQRWLKILTKKPIMPSGAEIEINPRVRSARLRVGEKI